MTKKMTDQSDAERVGLAILEAHGQWEIENRERGLGSPQPWEDGHVRLLGAAALLAAPSSPVGREEVALVKELASGVQAYMLSGDAHAQAAKKRVWAPVIARSNALIGDRPQDQWRMIETAPRDGTRILATGGGLFDAVEIVDYYAAVGCWNTLESTLDDRDDEPEGYSRPTHWQPLPAPPAPKAGE